MTYQVPPYRPASPDAGKAATRPARPFVPVPLMPSTARRKRPHWAVRAVRVLFKALFLCFCVFVGFVTFCVAFHQLTQWR